MITEEVDVAAPGVAEQVFAVRQAAYAQEARLLGIDDFPPLRRSIDDLRAGTGRSLVVRQTGRIVGVLELEVEAEGLCIGTLVVHPRSQGLGVGAALLRAAIAAAAGHPLEVQTASLNERALRLYQRHGFVTVRTWRLEQGLDLTRFRHPGLRAADIGRGPEVRAASPVSYERLSLRHSDELAAVLLNEPVYRHIGGSPPSPERFRLGMARALAGPPAHRRGESWINYAVREVTSGQLIGRLEATIHAPVAEVAFLYGPACWGKGYATQGLLWLHGILSAHPVKPELWATTVAANERCRHLLLRCGYEPVDPATAPRLLSYDPGDLVFRGPRLPAP